jgi:hypothetical protein
LDSDERVIAAAVRSIADLSLFQASGEIAALYARSALSIRSSVLDSAETTGEPLFRQALELAALEAGTEGTRAHRIMRESFRAGRLAGA